MTGLFDLDEGFYGAVVREMLHRGDWIIPHYNGAPWFEKPILFYWLAGPCVWLFGENVGPRLPSVLSAIGLYVLVGRYVARTLNPVVGRWTVLVVATSPIMAVVGRLMLVDALFVAVFSASLFALHRSLWDLRWRVVAGACVGLAVLAKGPVAIILFVGIAGATAWLIPDYRGPLMRGKENLFALLAMLAVVSVWYLPATIAGGPAFVQDFLIKQNLMRFAGGDLAHRVPWYLHVPYYFLVLGFGMLPWSWRIMLGWPRKDERGAPDLDFVRFCAIWATVVVLFFTISGSKLPHYVLPAFVPLAILAGRTLETRFFGFFAMAWSPALSLGLGIGLAYYYRVSGQREAHDLIRWTHAQGGAVGTYQLPRRQADRGTGKPEIQETSLPSLTFYLGRPLKHAETLEELARFPTPCWVFTRSGRLGAGDAMRLASRGRTLQQVRVPLPLSHYALYRISEREVLPKR